MRKIIVLSFVTLDGVVQAPGGPDEDTSGGFMHGGWAVPYFDEALGEVMGAQMSRPFDLLLGRKTFEIFAPYWSQYEGGNNPIHQATKYVASRTVNQHPWQNSVFLNQDIAAAVQELKQKPGPELQVHGSSQFIQTLLQHDLVDEFWLKIFPVTLGGGKRLFGPGVIPGAFRLFDSKMTPSGVIVASYQRAGEVKTGSF